MSSFQKHLSRFGLTVDDVEPTETPGCWRIKEPCGGLAGGCPELIHGFPGNEGPMQHTIQFQDDDQGTTRFLMSPYRTWKQQRESQP